LGLKTEFCRNAWETNNNTNQKRVLSVEKRAIEIFIDVFASSSCPTLKRQMNE
jgi:hypothetical protein